MRMIKVDIKNIAFEYQTYEDILYNSILNRGFAFPIHVVLHDDHYQCVDGHKRLSVLHDILKHNPDYHRGSSVCVIIKNNGDVRSNDCWKKRNSH